MTAIDKLRDQLSHIREEVKYAAFDCDTISQKKSGGKFDEAIAWRNMAMRLHGILEKTSK